MAIMYNEDRTGTLAANKVTNELHNITAENNRNYHFFIPKFAPFFEEGFKLFKSINGTQLELKENIDFYFVYKFEGASLSTAKNLFGAISFMDLTQEGEFSLEYQTVGSPWNIDEAQILEIIANEVYNPRGRTWDQTLNYPTNFGPTQHIQNEADFMSSQEVGEKLGDIAEAVSETANRPYNTPPITLEDLGIPKVGNWGMASVQQAKDGASNDTLISPLTLKAVLEDLGINRAAEDMKTFREHIQDTNNPHKSTKETVDLGSAANIGKASDEKILSNQDEEAYPTLSQLRSYLRIHGCQTAPDEEQKFPVKDSVLTYRCTSNYDRIGIFADGMGHTYEKIVESNSTTCGYRPPEKNNYPPHGTVLQYYCLDYDRWKIVADGYGGSYHTFVLANSGDCGYDGGSSTTKPPAGTLLSAYCDGTALVQTLANGNGGSYENRIPGHAQCADNVKCPDRDILVSTSCENKNEIGKYTDGACGHYNKVIVQNSTKCGYSEVTTLSPVSHPPHGTSMGTTCRGTNFVNLYADGNGGTYEEIAEYNSTRCGYMNTSTTTTTSRTPVVEPSLQYSSSLSYITPNTSVNERHSVTMTNGKPNSVYRLGFYMRASSTGAVTTFYVGNLTTGSTGTGSYNFELGIYGKDQTAKFVADDTYSNWAVASIDDGLGVITKSNLIPRTYAGFGQTPANPINIQYTIQPNQVNIGTMYNDTIYATGCTPNTNYMIEIYTVPTTVGYKSVKTYNQTVRSSPEGIIQLVVTSAMRLYPNGPTIPSELMPDGQYKQYIMISGAKSNEQLISWATGSRLTLNTSVFA